MSDPKTVTHQLQQLQTLMHRIAYHSGRGAVSPYWGQGKVLATLAGQPELSQKELGRQMGMSKQALTELLVKMEKTGYVERSPSQEDKRAMVVRLLEPGRLAAQGLESGGVEELFDCLSSQEMEQLSSCLDRLIRRCAASFPGQDSQERRRHMDRFLSRYDHSFAQFQKQSHTHRQGSSCCGGNSPEQPVQPQGNNSKVDKVSKT